MFTAHTGRPVEKNKKMNATILKRKLPRFTDQPQKTLAAILKGDCLSFEDVAEA